MGINGKVARVKPRDVRFLIDCYKKTKKQEIR